MQYNLRKEPTLRLLLDRPQSSLKLDDPPGFDPPSPQRIDDNDDHEGDDEASSLSGQEHVSVQKKKIEEREERTNENERMIRPGIVDVDADRSECACPREAVENVGDEALDEIPAKFRRRFVVVS